MSSSGLTVRLLALLGAVLFATTVVAAIMAVKPGKTGDTIADVELGQQDFFAAGVHAGFVHNSINFLTGTGGTGFYSPGAIAIYTDTTVTPNVVHMYFADSQNNRVLAFSYHFGSVTIHGNTFSSDININGQRVGNGAPAVKVIGQPDFNSSGCNDGTLPGDLDGLGPDSLCNPTAVAVDGSGNLYIADTGNNRVLEYNNALESGCTLRSCSSGIAADEVLGQSDFTSNAAGAGTDELSGPEGLAVDGAGDLFVSDTGNSRVLQYNTPLTTDFVPDMVFGQGGSFATNSCNNGGISADSLCNPEQLAFDSGGNLYVADTGNSRVLEFAAPLTTTANTVFGQGNNFTTGDCNSGGIGTNSLCNPTGVATDSSDNLYVADTGNNRVLEYFTPTTDTTADVAFGQASPTDFTDGFCNGSDGAVSGLTLCAPRGVALDNGDNLYVADSNNNRALQYLSQVISMCMAQSDGSGCGGDTAADLSFGEPDLTHNPPNSPGPRGFYNPGSVAVDLAGHLWVADSKNNRVLGWSNAAALRNSTPADKIIGQPDSNTTNCNDGTLPDDLVGVGRDSLCNPTGVAVDSNGNLYVADTNNSRVLEYDAPYARKPAEPFPIADRVFGQSNFTGTTCASPGAGLCNPMAAAIDSFGNLYVADTGNNRVAEYNTPLSASAGPLFTSPDNAFGQLGDLTTNTCFNGLGGNPAPSAGGMCAPSGVAVDFAGNLYAADTSNNRVLEFNQPLADPNSPNETANLVFGQADFIGNGCNQGGGASADTLCGPAGLDIDPLDNLYVADAANSRVLRYNAPLDTNKLSGQAGAGDTTADVVFGQQDFSGVVCNGGVAHGDLFGVGPDSLCKPTGVATDNLGNLYVADTQNNRTLKFLENNPQPAALTASPNSSSNKPIDLGKAVIFSNSTTSAATTKVKTITLHAIRNGPKNSPVGFAIAAPLPPFYFAPKSLRSACGSISSLKLGKSCTISLVYSPTDFGKQTGTLTITSNASNGPVLQIFLSGTGVAGSLSGPKSVSFGSVKFCASGTNCKSVTKTITLTNKTAADATLLPPPYPVTGKNPDDFNAEAPVSPPSQACASLSGNVLPAGKHCKIAINFKPGAKRSRKAALEVDYNSPNGPLEVSLRGAGQ
jgi:sugar lactone lactonase YvrE